MDTFIQQLSEKYSKQYKYYFATRRKLQDRLDKLKYPHWTKKLLRPIMNEIKKRTPEIFWDDDCVMRGITFGLRCECPVFGYTDKQHKHFVCSITFTDGVLENGEVCYDIDERQDKFPDGTVGEMNGWNNVSKPVESIDELVIFIENQVIRYKE